MRLYEMLYSVIKIQILGDSTVDLVLCFDFFGMWHRILHSGGIADLIVAVNKERIIWTTFLLSIHLIWLCWPVVVAWEYRECVGELKMRCDFVSFTFAFTFDRQQRTLIWEIAISWKNRLVFFCFFLVLFVLLAFSAFYAFGKYTLHLFFIAKRMVSSKIYGITQLAAHFIPFWIIFSSFIL